MVGGDVEDGGHLALRLAFAHERTVAARPQREREGVEQDRLARPRLAGENRHSRPEVEIETVDEDNIADRQVDEHGTCKPLIRTLGNAPPGRYAESLARPASLARLESLTRPESQTRPGSQTRTWSLGSQQTRPASSAPARP